MKKITLLFVLFVVVALALVSSVGGEGNNSSAPIRINEVRRTQSSYDWQKYFELAGTPGSSVDNLTYLVINQVDGDDGRIIALAELVGTIPADGYYLAVENTFTLGGNPDLITVLDFFEFVPTPPSHMLVRDFSGDLFDDLDEDDDGTLDAQPWTTLEDCVTFLAPPERGGHVYCDFTTGPDEVFVPAHNYLCQDGWRIGSFYDFNFDSPGERNDVCNGGNGQGPNKRVLRMDSMFPDDDTFGDATGMIEVIGTYQADHPNYDSWPPQIVYSIKEVPIASVGWGRQDGTDVGRDFYTLYLQVGMGERIRVQSFNTNFSGVHHGQVYMTDFSEEVLFSEYLHLWVCWENDNGSDDKWDCFLEGYD